jgi:hypothetical protein
MTSLNFGCNCTDTLTSGGYSYYLFSRVDNYAVILRQNTAATEYRFKVISGAEVVDTVWAAATSQTYVRPDKLDNGTKQYAMNKYKAYIAASKSVMSTW